MAMTRDDVLRELDVESRRSTAEGVFFFQAVAEQSGLNLTDLQAITILMSTGPITAGRLADMMGITTGAATGVINRMEQAGYVRRETDPDDKRRVVIRPVTEELERAGIGFFGSQERVLDELLADYDDRDLAVFLEIMRKANAMTREETAKLRTAAKGDEGGEFSTSLGAVASGRLVFANGADRLTLRSASGMDDLYRARFDGPAPRVKAEEGVVTFRYPGGLKGLIDWRRRTGDIVLSDAVPWAVEVRGGASRIEANLGALALTSFVLIGGFSDCILTLPEPSGVVPVRLSGGANNVRMYRPAGAEAKVTVKGGISKLTFDEQRFDAVGGKVQLQSPGYDGASSRYEIDISGGANEISIL